MIYLYDHVLNGFKDPCEGVSAKSTNFFQSRCFALLVGGFVFALIFSHFLLYVAFSHLFVRTSFRHLFVFRT